MPTWQEHQGRGHDASHEYRSPHLRRGQPRDLILGRLQQEVRRARSPTILDVGAGHGSYTASLLEAGASHVICTEMSTDAANVLRRRFADDNRVTVIDDPDGERLFEQGPVDMVCLISLLHHIPDYLSFLQRLPSVLATGGTLISFQDPNYYPRRSRSVAVIDKATYYTWRLAQGDLASGLKAHLRRSRGEFDEDDPRDMVEYHVVRDGVDEQAVIRALEDRLESVELVRYWSSHSTIWQRVLGRTSLWNTFGVVAKGAI